MGVCDVVEAEDDIRCLQRNGGIGRYKEKAGVRYAIGVAIRITYDEVGGERRVPVGKGQVVLDGDLVRALAQPFVANRDVLPVMRRSRMRGRPPAGPGRQLDVLVQRFARHLRRPAPTRYTGTQYRTSPHQSWNRPSVCTSCLY
jgi:hypothetical protein